MARTRLLVQEDFDAVRAFLLPQMTTAAQLTTLPNTTIQLSSVGGRAEALVIDRLGLDWQQFALYPSGTIPSYYAQGDPVTAVGLLHDALVQFCCMQLIALGFVQQLIPTSTRTADQQLTLGVNWEKRRQDFEAEGYRALFLLRRPQPVAGRSFISPAAGASGQMARGINTGPRWSPYGGYAPIPIPGNPGGSLPYSGPPGYETGPASYSDPYPVLSGDQD